MVLDLYSKRKKRSEMAGKTESYKYDDIPKEFRVQAICVFVETVIKISNIRILRPDLNNMYVYNSSRFQSDFWQGIHYNLAKEYGRFRLSDESEDPFEQVQHFFLNVSTPTNKLLDVVGYTFQFMKSEAKFKSRNSVNVTQKATTIINEAIEELNTRFEEHALGYELSSNFQIIEKSSKFVHKEIVKTSLELLHEFDFRGASNEFLSGHSHYRKGKYKEAINDALKSFESTMKTICEKKGWTEYKKANGASQLIDIMFEKELIPNFMRSHFNNLVQALKDGLPTVRNKVAAAHGQGEAITGVPRSLAQYALNLAATNIVFLVESYKDYDSSKVNPKSYS